MSRRFLHRHLPCEAAEIQAPFLLRSARTVKRIESLAVLQRIVRRSRGATTDLMVETANGVILAPAEVLALSPDQLVDQGNASRWIWPMVALAFIAMGGVLALLLEIQTKVPPSGAVSAPTVLAEQERRNHLQPRSPSLPAVQVPEPPPATAQTPMSTSVARLASSITTTFRTPMNSPLIVDAMHGPLAGHGGTSLHALLRSGPKNGKVGFYADGHFSYRPKMDFTGNDSFRIQIVDGAIPRHLVTISIEVIDPQP